MMTRRHATIAAGPLSVAAVFTLLLCRVSAGGVDPARAYEQLYGAKEAEALASATKADDVALAKELLADAARLADSPKLRDMLYGKAIGGAGEITLKKGRHDVHLAVGTHGGPYIRGATFRVLGKETKEQVPLVNSLAAIERFLARRLKGRKLTEVSGWDAAKARPVRVPYK